MSITLIKPENHAEINLLTKEQQDFFTDPNRFTPHEADPTPRVIDISRPAPLDLQWESALPARLQLAEDQEFKKLVFENEFTQNFAEIYNLELEKTYYWRVIAQREESDTFSFYITNQLPRMINIPCVTNVRDIGNWRTLDGKKIRQGMVYRGGCFCNEDTQSTLDPVTLTGIQVVTEELKIRTELDLRKEEGARAVSPKINFVNIPLSAYASWGEYGIFTPEQMERIKKSFRLFTDPGNYPVYVHCAGGGDRTGTLLYLLEAILGLNDEDLVTEYELSNLSVSGERCRFSTVWTGFMKKLDDFPGTNTKEKVESYLYACGITSAELDRIRNILLEND